MRCPSCASEIPAGAAVCSGCGANPPRPARRRKNDQPSNLLTPRIPNNPPAVTAYRYAVYGLVPVAGLFLGICAVGFGIAGYRRACGSPEREGSGHAMTAMILGGLEFLTNAAGLFLIGTGLQSFR